MIIRIALTGLLAGFFLVGCTTNYSSHEYDVFGSTDSPTTFDKFGDRSAPMFSKNKTSSYLKKRKRRKFSQRKRLRKDSRLSYKTRKSPKGYYVRRGASGSCFPYGLRAILNKVSRHYGKKVRVQSGYRSRRYNRRVGGVRLSYHIRCMAADIIVPGVSKYRLYRYLKSLPGVGGIGVYRRHRFVHVDIGPRRTWFK